MTRLIDATVQRRESDVAFTWKVQGDLEAMSKSWLLSFDLSGGDDGPIHQFQLRFEDGVRKVAYADLATDMHYSVPDVRPQCVGDTWKAVFPAGNEIARSGAWLAVLSFDEPDNSNESQVEGTF